MAPAQGKGSALSDQARFLILEIPESVERQTRILGCAVPREGVYDPFRHYRPWLGDKSLTNDHRQALEAISAGLWAEKPQGTVVLKDTAFDASLNTETDAQAQLTDLFQASVSKYKGHDVQITAGEAKMYKIEMVAGELAALVQSEVWMAQLNKLYDEIGRPARAQCLCLVTGVYTCKGLEVSWKQDEVRAAGGEAKLPLGQAAVGDPVIATKLNIGLKLNREKSEGSRVFARCDDELIFALAYDALILHFEKPCEPTKQGLLQKLNPFSSKSSGSSSSVNEPGKIINVLLGKPIRGTGIQPFAGEDDEADGASGMFAYDEPPFIHIARPDTPRPDSPEMDNGHA